MCRMMVKVGGAPNSAALDDFRELAASGNVLPGNSCGHGDGWGFAAVKQGEVVLFEKSFKDGASDPAYAEAARRVAALDADIVFAHLRKASVGDLTSVNAHPFVHGKYVFCHNGGVKESERIPVYGLEPDGETDSERFFLNIIGRLETGEVKALREACEAAIAYIRANHTYSSLCFFITDGQQVFVYRDFRDVLAPGEEKPKTWDSWPRYYTLYRSKLARAVSSQPLASMADDWELLPTKTLIELD
jgi:predicted glutamine amidotransferase